MVGRKEMIQCWDVWAERTRKQRYKYNRQLDDSFVSIIALGIEDESVNWPDLNVNGKCVVTNRRGDFVDVSQWPVV